MNLREQILAAKDRKLSPVRTPEWGTDIFVRTLSHAERRKVFAVKEKSEDLFQSAIVAAVACDKHGERIFSDDDAKALADKSGAVLDRIFREFLTLSALTPEEVEALEKKFSTPLKSN